MPAQISQLKQNLALMSQAIPMQLSNELGSGCERHQLKLISRFNQQTINIGSIELLAIPTDLLFQAQHTQLNPLNQMLTLAQVEAEEITAQDFVIYVYNFNVKTQLRGNGFGTALFEHFYCWLEGFEHSYKLFLNSGNLTKEEGGKQVPLDKTLLDYHLEKHRLQGWLNRLGFESMDQENSDLMLLPQAVSASYIQSDIA